MNCIDTRRALLANPATAEEALASHLATCEACAQFAARLAHEETLLREAASLPVPEHLEERILLQTRLRARRRDLSDAPRRWWNAVAGSVTAMRPIPAAYAAAGVLIVAVSAWWLAPSAPTMPWSEIALAHVANEPDSLRRESTLPPRALVVALSDYGLAVRGDLGVVRYLEPCAMPGGRGIHAVVDMPGQGRVTLILPPQGNHANEGSARGQGLVAQIVRIGEVGVAVVTPGDVDTSAVKQRLRERLVSRT